VHGLREVDVLDDIIIGWLLGWARASLDNSVLLASVGVVVWWSRYLAPVFARAVESILLPAAQAIGDRLARWIRGSPKQPP